MADPLDQTGASEGRFRSLEFGFLKSFIVSPCNIVSVLSNRYYSTGVLKYVDVVYTL